MFLDEKLLELGRKTKLDRESIIKCITEMIRICLSDVTKNLPDKPTDAKVKTSFKRVNNTFMAVVDILRSENRGFVKRDGFETYVNIQAYFKGVFL